MPTTLLLLLGLNDDDGGGGGGGGGDFQDFFAAELKQRMGDDVCVIFNHLP